MNKTRLQLTLFVSQGASAVIEKIRQEFNPEQHELIKCHVTLCREDELEQLEKVTAALTRLQHPPLTIDFGDVVRFSAGKGVLLPAVGENETFHKLREVILQEVNKHPRRHEPHITLMHPRNSTCTDSLFAQIKTLNLPNQLEFSKISLIEQGAGKKWRVLQEFGLTAASAAVK